MEAGNFHMMFRTSFSMNKKVPSLLSRNVFSISNLPRLVRAKYKSPYEQERVKVEEMFKNIHSSEYSIG